MSSPSASRSAPVGQILSKSEHLSNFELIRFVILELLWCLVYDVFSKTAATTSQINFRLRVWWLDSSVEVEIYACTKFRSDWPIGGRVKTTSGFWKQTAAILDFYFRFRFRPFYRHRHVILRWPTKFHPKLTICVWDMTSSLFSRWRPFAMLDLVSENYRPPTKCSCCS